MWIRYGDFYVNGDNPSQFYGTGNVPAEVLSSAQPFTSGVNPLAQNGGVASLAPSGIVGRPQYGTQANANMTAFNQSNAFGAQQANNRTWGPYRDPEDGSVNWGWVIPSQALPMNTPGLPPNPRPDLSGQAAPPQTATVGANPPTAANVSTNLAQSSFGGGASPAPAPLAGAPQLPAGAVQPTTSGGAGPYDAFNAAFAKQFGRPITQDEQSSNEFVQSLSNELFRLLPVDRQAGFSTVRLATLGNDDLMKVLSFNPQLLTGFPTERLLTFGPDVIKNKFISFLRTSGGDQGAQLAANLEQGLSTAPGGGGPGAGGPPAPGAPGTTPTPGQPGQNNAGVAPIQNGTFGNLTDYSSQSAYNDPTLAYQFPFGGNDVLSPQQGAQFGTENYLRGMGISPTTGNPYMQFIGSMIAPQAQQTSDYNTLYGKDASTRGILGGLNSFFQQGGNQQTQAQAGSYLNDLGNLVGNYEGGDPAAMITAEQAKIKAANPDATDEQLKALYAGSPVLNKLGLAKSLIIDPNRAYGAYTQAQAGSLSPYLRYNQGLQNSVQNDLYSSFLRASPNKPESFFSYLLGR